jgi:hypothetical protein
VPPDWCGARARDQAREGAPLGDASRAAFTQLPETSEFDYLGKAEVRFAPAHLRLTF